MERFNTKKDLMLMAYLRNNSRENITKISRLTSIPVSTIFDRIKDYEKTIIRKHTSLVDFRKLGFDIKMNILFKVERDTRDKLRDFLLKNEKINSLFRINNGFDFMVEAIFKDMSDMQRFMEGLERFNIIQKQELFILEDIKREDFLSDALNAELLSK